MYVGRTSWAYYNEIDEYAAQWIENLIRLGLVAPGVVDRRSIEDVRPDDLRGFRQCHFFAGIGVWSHALRGAGVPDDAPIWSGSCPCQPFSAAGQGGGVDDERHLWPAFFHLIDHCRPPRIYGEQVASKDGLGWLDLVLADMEASDYAIWAVDTPSAGSGAPHIRQRLRFCADDLRSSTGRLQHMSCNGWLQRRAEPSQWGAGGGCSIDILADKSGERWNGVEDSSGSGRRDGVENGGGVDRLDHPYHKGLEGLGQRYCSTTGQRQGSLRPVATPGGIDWVADTYGRNASAEWQQRGWEQRQQSQDGCADPLADPIDGHLSQSLGRPERRDGSTATHARTAPNRPSPTNAFWRDADWLFCRDGKWRPVVASHVEMVNGASLQLGRSGPFSTEESQTRLQAMLDTFGEKEIQRQAGGQWSFSESCVLRPDMYGGLDGGANQEPDSSEQSQAVCENCRGAMRNLSGDGDSFSCSSCGRKPSEQRPLELEDVVRLLPQSLSLAELYGRRDGANRLRVLQRAINEAGALLYPPRQGEAAWASIGEDAKTRIGLDFDVGAWRRVVSFPLVNGDDFKPGSGSPFEGKSRQGMLKGYGNAVDAQATIDFIEATLDTVDAVVGSSLTELLA